MTLQDYIKSMEGKPRQPFQSHVLVRLDCMMVEIALEDVPCHHEWIEGEAAYISIWRALDDNRVVGATLPLRSFGGNLPVVIYPPNRLEVNCVRFGR